MAFDLTRYLDRIGLTETPPPTLEGLARLHWAQMTTLPFENIDPLIGRLPSLTDEDLEAKLITGGRGGYCVELNGLLARALPLLGFQSRPVLARVRLGAAQGGWRSHYAHLVSQDGQDWIIDTAFGRDTYQAPLNLADPEEQALGDGFFRQRPDHETGETVIERKKPDGSWFALYGFDRIPVAPPDIDAVNILSTHPAARMFPHHLMVAIAVPGGRLTLLDRTHKRLVNGLEEVREITSRDDMGAVLTGPFRLTLDDALVAQVWERVLAAPPLPPR
ncbi:MAG: arylamine N-acetyltransferase [Rhodospirillum sp.]|nr:arylamine N-acetyltransferase [Rhodospirillum sp.]MCF8488526.1 arylamine N-acetyltransferase [Rhodospirillum sp.]MCF8499271.1 arylamine N-acetyltransferase [Rhodospirillum sp.]